ncbi:MAG: YibE/F family protein, partial [Spirochaetes bacterium]|nr:YibE/F family protein [Spirochaetota bacterium]
MNIRREWTFSIVIACLCATLAFLDICKIPQAAGGVRSRALITEVDNSRVRINLIVKTNAQ